MSSPVKIDFVSDLNCPWCIIGLKGLEIALERLDGVVDADIHFQPFELNPDTPPGGVNVSDHLGKKYGMTREQTAASGAEVSQRAAGVGFTMVIDDKSRSYNSFDAHRLLHWAHLKGRQLALKEALFTAHFTEGLDISDHQILAAKAEAAGLAAEDAVEVLASGRYAEEVREAQKLWQARGVSSVPAIIINDRHLISGGQPADVFEKALRSIAIEGAAAA